MVTIIKACITNPLTGKLFGEVEADKNTSNKELYFLASISMVWSQNWPRLLVDIFSLKLQRIRYQKNQIYIFEDFLQIKTWQKYASKWFPIKFITAWLLRTATFFKASIKYRSNVAQALFWDLESRINSLRTMKKKAKNIDRSIQNGAISINFFVKWQLCFELPFKLVNPAPFLNSTTHLKVQLFEH